MNSTSEWWISNAVELNPGNVTCLNIIITVNNLIRDIILHIILGRENNEQTTVAKTKYHY